MKLVFQKCNIRMFRYLQFFKNEISFVVYSSKFMHEKKYLINPLDWYKIGYKEQKDDQNKPNYYKKIILKNDFKNVFIMLKGF